MRAKTADALVGTGTVAASLASHYQHDLLVLVGVLLGGVLLVLDGVQMVAVRDLRMVRGLFMVAGFVMFGRFAMMLGRVLVMVGGVLVMLMNLVIVHSSVSGLMGKAEALRHSMNLFRRRCVRSVPVPRYAARPAHLRSCTTSCRTACTTLSQSPNRDCR